MDSLYIVIPAYNEQENISGLIEEWYPKIEKYNSDGSSRLIIINDGSKDNTADMVREEMQQRPYLVLLNKKNGGHGPAVMTGYRYALRKKADYIFQTDSDRQTLPGEFDYFWRRREEFDAIIGKRSDRKDGTDRIFVTKVLKILLFAIYRRNIPDANSPFRLMKSEVLKDALKYLEPGENLPNICISAVFIRKNRRVLYKKITFRPRQGGTNSLNMKKIVRIGMLALKRFYRLSIRLDKSGH